MTQVYPKCDLNLMYLYIELAIQDDRIYLPNQICRELNENIETIWFCKRCMREIEDNLRATIAYRKSEGEQSDESSASQDWGTGDKKIE